MSEPTVSVIVCTLNRVESLKRCLQAFANISTSREWELIVVDNGSTDATGEFLASHPAQVGTGRLIITTQPTRGLAKAQNKGIKRARGPIIAFTDDDCYPAEDYIDMMAKAFEENPEIGFIGGRILLFDPTDLYLTVNESEKPIFYPARSFIAAGEIQGANMAFRRSTIDLIGGISETIGDSSDIDAISEALWSGIAGVYDPRPTVQHHHGRKTQADGHRLIKSYDEARGRYFAKYIMNRRSRSEFIQGWLRQARVMWCDQRYGRIKAFAILARCSLREAHSGLVYFLKHFRDRPIRYDKVHWPTDYS